jgi:indolepyruvate decarboxylase
MPGKAHDTGTVVVGAHLLARLKELGCDHVFGIPGDFVLPFFDLILESELDLVSPCNEFNGGYATDAYARIKGIGAMAVTYGPGGMSVVNAMAGAYAEHVPMVLISGAPDSHNYDHPRLMHHVIEHKLSATTDVYRPITIASEVVREPATAIAQIDAALAKCLAYSQPIYLELPRDVQVARVPAAPAFERLRLESDPRALEQAVEHAARRIREARIGAVLPGHLIQRAGLERAVIRLTEVTGYPVASMLIGKADYLEHLPQCLGPYQGGGSPKPVRERIEASDVILSLGVAESDFNLGGFTANLRDAQMVRAGFDEVRIGAERYSGVRLRDFVESLLTALPHERKPFEPLGKHFVHTAEEPYIPCPADRITNKRLFDRLAHFLRKGDVATGDAGGLIEATYIEFPQGARFVGQSYWASIGYGFGAALGACFAAGDDARVLCFEGDGSFQMTAQEISTMVRYRKDAIIVVLNNKGYDAERLIHEAPYNDIQDWQYHRLAEVFGGVTGAEVRTEGDLEAALSRADGNRGRGPFIVNVHLEPLDASEAFKLMSVGLRAKKN